MKDFLLIFSNVFFTVIGHLMLKYGMTKVGRVSSISSLPATIYRSFSNPFVLLGLAVFVGTSMLWLIVLSRVKLSLAYPMLSMSYVLAILLSWLLLKEHIPWIRILGAFVIISGVCLVSITTFNVKGAVTDAYGKPAAGVKVIVKNTMKGKMDNAVTDEYGKYRSSFWDFLGSGTSQDDEIEVSVEEDGNCLATIKHPITKEEMNRSSIEVGVRLPE